MVYVFGYWGKAVLHLGMHTPVFVLSSYKQILASWILYPIICLGGM